MALTTRLSVRQVQRISLTPQMRQALHVLRLPSADLADEVARAAADNPFLTVDWPAPRGTSGAAYDFALDTVAAQPSLVEDLHRQIGLMRLPGRIAALAGYLAGDLREDGYLDLPLADLGVALGATTDEMEAALAALQRCEPAGIGARSLAECLELQLCDRGVARALARTIVAHLDEFAARDRAGLARTLGVGMPELDRIAGWVRGLRAQPASPAAAQVAPPLRPDLVVSRNGSGGLQATLADAAHPQVGLDERMLAAAADTELAAACRARGIALIRALEQRRTTLERIGLVLAEAQHRFFAHGPEHLVPLNRSAVAETLGLHPSTVGRAVAGKALEFDGRLFPLSRFFSSSLGVAGGNPVSAFAAQQAIARIVAHEPPDAPLPDAAIRDRLRAEGVDITRRTVAKYRSCMRIPSSFHRHRRRAPHRPPPGAPAGNPRDTS